MISIFSVVIALFSCFARCGEVNNINFLPTVVESEDSGYIYTESHGDDNGWCLKNTLSLQKGDQLLIVYDDGGTVDIYDDVLLSIVRL